MVVQKKFNDCMVQIDSESKFQLKCTSKSVGQNKRTAFTSTTYIEAIKFLLEFPIILGNCMYVI